MDIKIDEAQMQSIVADAIFKTLNEDSRNTLIQQAIAYLIKVPEKTRYNDPEPKSPLQQAFHNALFTAANVLIRQQMDSDPAIKEKILGLLTEAMAHAFETSREATVHRVSSALVSALVKD
jgi:hypothetical protein